MPAMDINHINMKLNLNFDVSQKFSGLFVLIITDMTIAPYDAG